MSAFTRGLKYLKEIAEAEKAGKPIPRSETLGGPLSGYASTPGPTYSAVDKAAIEMARTKGTGAEFMTELSKTKGVKPAEIADRRLDVIRSEPKMTKDQLLKRLEQKPVPILREKTYSVNPSGENFNEAGNWVDREDYSKWQLPGGENYREMLVHYPPTIGADFGPANDYRLAMEAKYGRFPHLKMTPDELKQQTALQSGNPNVLLHYNAPHFGDVTATDLGTLLDNDSGNLLGHMRVSDRIGPNNEKILHLEELQSDLHQTGRDKGYQTVEQKKAAQKAAYEANFALQEAIIKKNHLESDVKNAEITYGTNHPNYIQAREAYLNVIPEVMKARTAADNIAINESVPDAPFKKTWPELLSKRLLHYAADNGYDAIGITPGMENAKRYSLANHFNEIHYSGSNLIGYDKNGNEIVRKTGVLPEQLPEYIGQEASEKLLAQPAEGTLRSLSNLDLEVGGEGMKGFYDQILPNVFNDIGKPYGARMQPFGLKIPVESGEAQLHRFDLTPEMREEIKLRGLPLYTIPAAIGAGAILGSQVEQPQGMKKGGKVNLEDQYRLNKLNGTISGTQYRK
jgi:hypothetical protein